LFKNHENSSFSSFSSFLSNYAKGQGSDIVIQKAGKTGKTGKTGIFNVFCAFLENEWFDLGFLWFSSKHYGFSFYSLKS